MMLKNCVYSVASGTTNTFKHCLSSGDKSAYRFRREVAPNSPCYRWFVILQNVQVAVICDHLPKTQYANSVLDPFQFHVTKEVLWGLTFLTN